MIATCRCTLHTYSFDGSGADTVLALIHVCRIVAERSVAAAAGANPPEAPHWWEREIPTNMTHVTSVQELVNELAEGAKSDQLVVVDFFAPWCAACRALFPKLRKLCAEHPDVRFVAVNFEDSKSLARGLNVKVLPFFQFYRGAEGRVDGFPASVSKVQKLRDAIENYKSDRCFLEEAPPNPLAEFPDVLPGGESSKGPESPQPEALVA